MNNFERANTALVGYRYHNCLLWYNTATQWLGIEAEYIEYASPTCKGFSVPNRLKMAGIEKFVARGPTYGKFNSFFLQPKAHAFI